MKELNTHGMYYAMFLGGLFLLNFICSTIPSVATMILQFVVMFAEVLLVYRFTLDAKYRILDGEMKFSTAYVYVLKLFLYAGMLVAFCKYMYFAFIDTDFLLGQFDISAKLLGGILSDVDMDTLRSTATNPALVAINSIWYNVLAGGVVGLVVSGYVVKK